MKSKLSIQYAHFSNTSIYLFKCLRKQWNVSHTHHIFHTRFFFHFRKQFPYTSACLNGFPLSNLTLHMHLPATSLPQGANAQPRMFSLAEIAAGDNNACCALALTPLYAPLLCWAALVFSCSAKQHGIHIGRYRGI